MKVREFFDYIRCVTPHCPEWSGPKKYRRSEWRLTSRWAHTERIESVDEVEVETSTQAFQNILW